MRKGWKIGLVVTILIIIISVIAILWIDSMSEEKIKTTEPTSFIQKSSGDEVSAIEVKDNVRNFGNDFIKVFFTFNSEQISKSVYRENISDKYKDFYEKYGVGSNIQYELTSVTQNETSVRLNYDVTGTYKDNKKERFAMIVNVSTTNQQLTLSNFSVVDLNE